MAASSGTAAAASAASASASASSASHLQRVLGPFPSARLTPAESRIVALDCEMVGVGPGGERSALAQVVVVDFAGRVLYATHVRVAEPVTDYRTHVSGITPAALRGASAVPFAEAQAAVAALLRGRTLVGHALQHDLRALALQHARAATRDTARYAPLCTPPGRDGRARPRRLKALALAELGVEVQTGRHDPAEDARAALALYKKHRREWEVARAGQPRRAPPGGEGGEAGEEGAA